MGALTFSNSAGVSFGLQTGGGVGTITGSIATTYAGTGFTTASTVNAQMTGTLNTSGLSIAEAYLTRLIVPGGNQLSVISAPGNASASFQYVPLQAPLSATRLDALASWAAMGSAANTGTAAIALSAYAAIYTNNAATLSSLSSGSTQTTYSYASNSAGHTELQTAAIRPISVPFTGGNAINMAPGEYVVGFNFLTATTSISTATTSFGLTLSMMGGNALQTAALPYAEIGVLPQTGSNLIGGMGVYTAATTGLPIAPTFAQIAQSGASQLQANIGLVLRLA